MRRRDSISMSPPMRPSSPACAPPTKASTTMFFASAVVMSSDSRAASTFRWFSSRAELISANSRLASLKSSSSSLVSRSSRLEIGRQLLDPTLEVVDRRRAGDRLGCDDGRGDGGGDNCEARDGCDSDPRASRRACWTGEHDHQYCHEMTNMTTTLRNRPKFHDCDTYSSQLTPCRPVTPTRWFPEVSTSRHRRPDSPREPRR